MCRAYGSQLWVGCWTTDWNPLLQKCTSLRLCTQEASFRLSYLKERVMLNCIFLLCIIPCFPQLYRTTYLNWVKYPAAAKLIRDFRKTCYRTYKACSCFAKHILSWTLAFYGVRTIEYPFDCLFRFKKRLLIFTCRGKQGNTNIILYQFTPYRQ